MVKFRLMLLAVVATAAVAAPLELLLQPVEKQIVAARSLDDGQALEPRMFWTHLFKGVVEGSVDAAEDGHHKKKKEKEKRDLFDEDGLLLARGLDESAALEPRSKVGHRIKEFFEGFAKGVF